MKPNRETQQVKLSCSRAGHTFDDQGRQLGVFSQSAGDVVDMPTAEAKRYIERGLATPVIDNSTK